MVNNNNQESSSKVLIDNYTKTIFKGSLFFLFGQAFLKIFSFLHSIIIVRTLGPSLFGVYSLGTKIFTYITPLTLLGFPAGLLYFNSKNYGKRKYDTFTSLIRYNFRVLLPISIILTVFIFLMSDTIANIFNDGRLSLVIKLISLLLPFQVINNIYSFSFQSMKKIEKPVFLNNVIMPGLKLILETSLVLTIGIGLVGFVNIYIFCFIFVSLLLYYFHSIEIKRITKIKKYERFNDIKRFWSYSIPRFFSNYIIGIIFTVDVLMLGYFYSSSIVGKYSVALALSSLLTTFLIAVNNIFSPIISELHGDSKIKELDSLFKISARWILALSLPIAWIYIIKTDMILSIFGKGFIVASSALIILTCGQLLNISTGSVGLMIVMSGRSKLALINDIFVVIINITLNFILIPKYQMIGAAIATAISISAFVLICLIEVIFLLKISPYNRDILEVTFYSLLFIIIFFIGDAIIMNLFLIIICTMVYFFLVYKMFSKKEVDRILFLKILNKLAR